MRRNRNALLPVLGLMLLGPLCARARADLLEFTFAGTITSYYDPQNLLGLGETRAFSGSFTYDPSDPDTDPDPSYGLYRSPAIAVACTVGTRSFSGGDAGSQIAVDNDPSGHDFLAFWTDTFMSGGATVKQVKVGFDDYTGTALASDVLPVATPDLQGFPGGGFYINIAVGGAEGRLTSFAIVPEPTTLALLGVPAVFLGLRRPRRANRGPGHNGDRARDRGTTS